MDRRSLAAAGVLVALAACATWKPNPERKACSDACVEAKNRCMVAATTADAVARCDADHRTCANPCLALPARVRAQ